MKTPFIRRGKSHLVASNAIHESPRKIKSMLSERATTSLRYARKATDSDIGSKIPEVPTKEFFDKYLPSLKKDHRIADIVAILRASGDLNDEGWSFFPPPKGRKRVHEDICFSDLKKVIEPLINAAKKSTPDCDVWQLVMQPNRTPKGQLAPFNNRPDANLCLFLRKDKLHWQEAIASGEFKKDDEDFAEITSNISQLVFDMSQTMRNDPSRRFNFGFSIENTTMRIWRCDRSGVLVCEPFDFHGNYSLVIQFFLSLMFASKVQLGWDPSMERAGANDWEYIITVRQEDGQELKFHTTKLLSHVSAQALCGRASRVWQCELVDANKNVIDPGPFAIKDTWIDDDREREGNILAMIRELGNATQRAYLQKHTLSVFCHGDVYINGEKDTTVCNADEESDYAWFSMMLQRPDAEQRRVRVQKALKDMGNAAGGPAELELETREHGLRSHYRIVYREVGTPLQACSSLRKCFMALGETLKALDALHQNGWVHRDISASNLFLVGGTVKIGDFEYAKRFDRIDSHKIITANLLFEPVEIARNRYLFGQKDNRTWTQNTGTCSYKTYRKRNDTGQGPSNGNIQRAADPKVLIQYNPLHDLESVCWNALYLPMNRKVVRVGQDKPLERSEKSKNAQKEAARALFTQAYLSDRVLAMTNALDLETKVQSLHPCLDQVAQKLLEVFDLLRNAYKSAERDITTADWFTVAKDLHGAIQSGLFEVASLLEKCDIKIRRFHESLEDDEDDDEDDEDDEDDRDDDDASDDDESDGGLKQDSAADKDSDDSDDSDHSDDRYGSDDDWEEGSSPAQRDDTKT